MKKDDIAIRKRTQITKASRTMFLWIAIASVLVGVGVVVGIFLFQKLIYTERVLAEKQATLRIVEANKEAVATLSDEIRVLDTNSDLASVKANPDDQSVQVILDALPSEANSLALGSSLQAKLLSGIGSSAVESLRVDPVIGVESLTGDESMVDAEATEMSEYAITFQFTMRGSDDELRQALQNLEKSIRSIIVTSVNLESQSGTRLMTVNAKAFYSPAVTLELTDKVVPK